MKNIIAETFDQFLLEHSFKRKGGTWYYDCPETILVANLQKSQYGDQFYINLGVWFKALGTATNPKEHLCQIRIRLETLSGEKLERALNLEDLSISELNRRMAIETSMKEHAIPFLNDCNSIEGVKNQLANGRLSDAFVHASVRDHIEK